MTPRTPAQQQWIRDQLAKAGDLEAVSEMDALQNALQKSDAIGRRPADLGMGDDDWGRDDMLGGLGYVLIALAAVVAVAVGAVVWWIF